MPSISRTQDNDSSIAGDSTTDWQTAIDMPSSPIIQSSPLPSRRNTLISSKRHRSQVSESGNPEYTQRIQSMTNQRDALLQQIQERKLEKDIARLEKELQEINDEE